MAEKLRTVKIGLAMVLLGMLFGVGMGVSFGVKEDAYKAFITEQVKAHPEVHDVQGKNKIWRYAQRAHFHATGIAAFSLGLIILLMFTDMRQRLKAVSSFLIGLSGLYPLAWFNMFFLAPYIGREAAHHHFITEALTYMGVGGLLLGMLLLALNLFFGLFRDEIID
ncbi:MAG: hypothetical protein Q8P28_09440 [Deltaproteobacteria bacterium]|nr:hypothetical protein [Deltaproteobacteria bacterium]